jgi:hypothetical protein
MAVPKGLAGLAGLLCVLLLQSAREASAQGVFDAVGGRALGMGGAFVAVADDPSAVQWNPAGLARGDLVGLTIGWHGFHSGNLGDRQGARGRTTLTSLGTWPLGLSFGSFDHRRVQSLTASATSVRRLSVWHGGVTVLQTVLDGLEVGATARIVRAELREVVIPGATLRDALPAVDQVRGRPRTDVDMDLGVLAHRGRVRGGLSVRNLRSIAVRATSGNPVALPRQARAGVSVQPRDGVTLAMDLDLNAVDLMGDLRRMSALGVEVSLGSRLLVRSGVRWNLAVASGPAGAVGASVRVRRGFWLDVHVGPGQATEARQASVGLRAGF